MQARREHAAGRLIEKVPALASLRLAFVEARASGWRGGGYVRHVDLGRALALFELPCSYVHCQGGGYDRTGDLLGGLRTQRARFEGGHACVGRCGPIRCTRMLYFEARAAYLPRSGPAAEAPAPEPEPPALAPRFASR
ncbi:MAG TPA: hypothetical protein VFS43_10545 [Polyangiaceae bacterium]|nr:hypothetical protein [Polyangiaceae bacterium]